MKQILVWVTLLLLLAGLGRIVSASGAYQESGINQPDVTYTINWYSVDGGGGRSTSANVNLIGTIGQYDAGAASGGPFQLAGGFWAHTVPSRQVYLPAVRR